MIPPAKTGSDNNNKPAVMKIDHTNNGRRCHANPGARILIVVQIKLIAPNMLLAPDKCKLNIAKSTDGPE